MLNKIKKKLFFKHPESYQALYCLSGLQISRCDLHMYPFKLTHSFQIVY